MIVSRAKAILDFWFQGLNDAVRIDKDSPVVKRWFTKSEQTDQEIRQRFEADLIAALDGQCSDWESSGRGRLALIVLYDQFSRNIYRGTAKMFAADPQALALTRLCIADGSSEKFQLIEQAFLYLPLMHSESLEVQRMSVHHFGALVDQAADKSPANIPYFKNTLDFAKRHYDIVEKFGRFPHRNEILNRDPSGEEIRFLKTPGSSF